jgi:hypothetical protein
MEAGNGHQGWKSWLDWLLWWKIDPSELRGQAEGYDTLPMIGSARGFSLLLALGIGVGQAISGVVVAAAVLAVGGWSTYAGALGCKAEIAFCSFAVATGLLFPILGRLAWRGSKAAICAMLGLWTAVALLDAGLWLYWNPPAVTAPGAVVVVLGWGVVVHPLYVALRVERERSGTAAKAAALTGL